MSVYRCSQCNDTRSFREESNEESYICTSCLSLTAQGWPAGGLSSSPKLAKTDKLDFSLTEIPYSSLVRLGQIFLEGSSKYGKGNWREGVGDKKFKLERANHALKHLLIYVHELETGEYIGELKKVEGGYDPNFEVETLKHQKEDDLAKVMWFCAIAMELERLESK